MFRLHGSPNARFDFLTRLRMARLPLWRSSHLHKSLKTLTQQLRVERFGLRLTSFPQSLMTEVCFFYVCILKVSLVPDMEIERTKFCCQPNLFEICRRGASVCWHTHVFNNWEGSWYWWCYLSFVVQTQPSSLLYKVYWGIFSQAFYYLKLFYLLIPKFFINIFFYLSVTSHLHHIHII